MFSSMAKFLHDGGTYMYWITAIMLFGIAVSAERLFFLLKRFDVDGRKFYTELRKLVENGDMAAARALCTEAPLPRILGAGLEVSGKSETAIQNAVDEAALSIIPTIEKRTPYISMVANVATLLGLIGTIQGLIFAFDALANADPSQKGAMLAQGISMAMYTTYYGLMVAIPHMIVYSYIQAKTTKIITEIDEYSVKFINFLIARQKGE